MTFSIENRGYRTVRFDARRLAAGQVSPVLGDRAATELVSLGPPLPDFEVDIRDGRPHVGRIWVRGPSLMKGYVGTDQQPFDAGGWLDTGDVGFVYEGELFVTGRGKDLLVVRGRNHAPQDLERAADEVEGVRTGCAVAVADVGEHGEQLLFFVEARSPRKELANDVLKAVRGATGVAPDLVQLLAPGTLPRTSSGKLRRGETLARYRAGTLTPPDKVTPLLLAGAMARSSYAYWRSR